MDVTRLRAMPKAEIHIHLEGCFDPDLIVALARENAVSLPRPEPDLLKFSGLAEFLEFLDFTCALTRTADQLARAAYAFAERMAAGGVGYADLIVNPTHWHHWRKNIPGFIAALDAGFRAAEEDGLPPTGLCISLLRSQTATEAEELVEILIALHHPRVKALSVDGNEAIPGRTGPKFATAFQRAGAAGLRRTVHAGESSGPEGVRDAIDLLRADRIDHGVRAIEDPALVRELADRQIPLGICPQSNIVLGLYPDRAEHPIERLRQAGVPVSLNTDDPALLQIDLPEEYRRAAKTFDWSQDICADLAATSIRASFAEDDLKADLLKRLATWRS